MDKPRQGFWGLWNISFGFFGIQLAFGLQNANISRIFQTLGSDVESLAYLWIAGPVTGLLIQPLIGHFSDTRWTRFGRRRPYFMAGAILGGAALFGMPYAPILLIAAMCLWMIDASLNVAMEPFRAFVGDMLSPGQQAAGYAFQTAFIGAGAVVGSLAPKFMTMLGVANTADPGVVPDSVRYAFMLGGAAMVVAVFWTIFMTREYSPDEMRAFRGEDADAAARGQEPLIAPTRGPVWLLAGAVLLLFVWTTGLDKQLYVLGGALAALFGNFRRATGKSESALAERMAKALARFKGQVLVVTSGKDLVAREFLDTIGRSVEWRRLVADPRVAHHDIADADHTFSTAAWRDEVAAVTVQWLHSW